MADCLIMRINTFLIILANFEEETKVVNMRQVILYRGEDGCWIAECPSLRGCISQGSNKEEALSNIKEAIEGYVSALEEDGLPVPEDQLDAMLVAV